MFEYGKSICYQGYRKGQSIIEGVYPSKKQVLEDLKILEKDFDYIRLYDTSRHTYDILELIDKYNINLRVMISMYLFVEENHKNHLIFGEIENNILELNITKNNQLCIDVISLANKYRKIIFSVSVGNEARSVWNVNRVSDLRISKLASAIKSKVDQLVTYCEEWKYWISDLPLTAAAVDFISIHSYPIWNGFDIDDTMKEIDRHYRAVKSIYKDKVLVITETGWPTKTDQKKIPVEWATVENQNRFISLINLWSKENDVLTFIFEAFDEIWKGSSNPNDPEKNWGLYYDNRNKK